MDWTENMWLAAGIGLAIALCWFEIVRWLVIQ
jgi:hypothetical protein